MVNKQQLLNFKTKKICYVNSRKPTTTSNTNDLYMVRTKKYHLNIL